jgi:hypothetical protein
MHLVAIIILACVIGGGDAVRLFNGTDLRGWERKAVHGGHGGVWWVEGGCIVGDQEPDHGGGLLGTLASYGDFEISLEFLAEEPLDSGLFLRTAPNGNGYQITIDCRPGGTVAAIYASGVGGFVEENDRGLSAYRKGEWNRLRVRIQGQPPRIEVWLNGSQTADWQDTKVRLPSTGYVGLQVHGGGGAWGDGNHIRFRNIILTPAEGRREVPYHGSAPGR